jgi:large conductance mechanosensitive channel
MPFVQVFKSFALRGNMLDLAVGFTVGAAFTTLVRSLVDDVLMPPVGLLLGSADFADLFVVLAPGESTPPPYATLKAAQEAGAVTLNYGRFINAIIALSLVALAMFVVIRVVNRLDATLDAALGDERPAEEPTHKKCPFCISTIPFPATRCPECTSELPQAAGNTTVPAPTS